MSQRSAYFAAPLLALGGPLVLLPSVAQAHQASGLATLLLGLSCGGLVAIVAELGWALTGPMQVSSISTESATSIYRFSVMTKLVTATALLPVLAALVFGLLDGGLDTFVIAAGSLTACFSSSWFFAGLDQPWNILRFESGPRLAAALLSAALMVISAPVWSVGVVSLTMSLLMVFLSLRFVGPGLTQGGMTLGRVIGFVRSQVVVVRLRLASGFYQAGAPAAASSILTDSFSVFASADRLLRLANTVLQVVPLSQQAQMGRAHERLVWGVGLRLVLINVGLAFFTCTLLITLSPIAEKVLFANAVDIPLGVYFLASAALFFGSLGRAVAQLWLVRVEAVRSIEIATYIAGCSFAILLLSLAPLYGVEGAMGAVAGAEIAGCATLLIAAFHHWRSSD